MMINKITVCKLFIFNFVLVSFINNVKASDLITGFNDSDFEVSENVSCISGTFKKYLKNIYGYNIVIAEIDHKQKYYDLVIREQPRIRLICLGTAQQGNISFVCYESFGIVNSFVCVIYIPSRNKITDFVSLRLNNEVVNYSELRAAISNVEFEKWKTKY